MSKQEAKVVFMAFGLSEGGGGNSPHFDMVRELNNCFRRYTRHDLMITT